MAAVQGQNSSQWGKGARVLYSWEVGAEALSVLLGEMGGRGFGESRSRDPLLQGIMRYGEPSASWHGDPLCQIDRQNSKHYLPESFGCEI